MLVLVATAGPAVWKALLTPASEMASNAWAGWDAGRANSIRPTAATNEGSATPALHTLFFTTATPGALEELPTAFMSTPPATCIRAGFSAHDDPSAASMRSRHAVACRKFRWGLWRTVIAALRFVNALAPRGRADAQ